MTSPGPPPEVIGRYLDAVRRDDWDTALGFVAEDIRLPIPARSAFAGEHRGRDTAAACIEAPRAKSHGAAMELEPIDTLASAERVALIISERFSGLDGVSEIRRADIAVDEMFAAEWRGG